MALINIQTLMKKRNYLTPPVKGFLAGAILAVGLGAAFSPAAKAVTTTSSDESFQQALYNELTAVGASTTVGVPPTVITGTAVGTGTGVGDPIKAELELEFGTATASEYTTKILPAIKAVSAEFPDQSDKIVSFALGMIPAPAYVSGSSAPTDYEKQLKGVLKAVYDGSVIGIAEWNRDAAANPLTITSQDVAVNIASAASGFLSAHVAPYATGTTAAQKAAAAALLADVKGIIGQTMTAGVVGLSGSAQWALAGNVVSAVANGVKVNNQSWFSTVARDNAGLAHTSALVDLAALATSANVVLTAKLAGVNEAALLNGLGVQTMQPSDAGVLLSNLAKNNAANVYAFTKAALVGNASSAQSAASYLQNMVGNKIVGYPTDAVMSEVVRAAADSLSVNEAQNIVTAFMGATATTTTGTASFSVALPDASKIAIVAGAVAAKPANASSYVGTALPLIGGTAVLTGTLAKDSPAITAKNTAYLALAKAVSTKVALVSGTAAINQLPAALSEVLGRLAATSAKSLDMVKLDFANNIIAGINLASTTPTTSANNAALEGGLAQVRDALASGTTSRVNVTAALLKGAAGKAPAINEIARVFSSGNGFGGAISSGSAFLASVSGTYEAGGSALGKLADESAFAAGLAGARSSEVDAITMQMASQIDKANQFATPTAVNTCYLTFGKALLNAKDQTGAPALGSSSIITALGDIFPKIKKDGAIIGQTDIAVQGAFVNSLVTLKPASAADIVTAVINKAGVTTPQLQGILLGGIVSKLGTDTANVKAATTAAINVVGSANAGVFLQNLVETAGSAAAGLQGASSVVASNLINSGTTSAWNVNNIANVLKSGTSTKYKAGIDKVVAGAAEAIAVIGSNQDVADLAKLMAPDHDATSPVLAAKLATSVTFADPKAAVQIATTLSQILPAMINVPGTTNKMENPAGMAVAGRGNVAANTVTGVGNSLKSVVASSGTATDAFNAATVTAIGRTFPSMAAGIAEGVITNMYQSSASFLADKASVIGGMVKALSAFNAFGFGTDAINNLAAYSLTSGSGNGYTTGAGFTSLAQRELLLSKVVTSSGVGYGGANLIANAVTSAVIASGTLKNQGDLVKYATDLLKGTPGDATTSNTNSSTHVVTMEKVVSMTANLDATLYGIAQAASSGGSPLLSGTADLVNFSKNVVTQFGVNDLSATKAWSTVTATSNGTGGYNWTITGTSKIVYDASTKLSQLSLNGMAAGLAKFALNNGSSISADLAAALASVSYTSGTTFLVYTGTGSGTTKTPSAAELLDLKGVKGGAVQPTSTVLATGTGTLVVPDSLKAGIAAAVVAVDPSSYLNVAKSVAGTYQNVSDAGQLATLANKIAGAVTGKTGDELAAIASSVVLGAASNLSALYTSQGLDVFNAAVANIAAQVIKVNGSTKLAAYDIAGAVMQTVKSINGSLDLSTLATAISGKLTGLGVMLAGNPIQGALSALNGLPERDHFDVGPVTHSETPTVNW